MKVLKIILITTFFILTSCSNSNSKFQLSNDDLLKATKDHITRDNNKEKRFENFEVTILGSNRISDKTPPVYQARYQVQFELAEDLYDVKFKKSCGKKYITYKVANKKGSKHNIDGTLIAKYKTGFWDYRLENETEIKGKKLPDIEFRFTPDSIEEIDFIKETCKKMGKESLNATFAALKSKVILIDEDRYSEIELQAQTIDGEKTYSTLCASCHNTGESGSPRLDDKKAWHPQIKTIKKALLQNIIIAEGSRHPKAGEILLSEAEILASIDYMLNELEKK